jgi:hypothetical protein
MRLLDSVLTELKNSSPAHRRFVGHLLELLLMLPGRATWRNLSRYSPYHEKTFGRWFAKNIDGVQVNQMAILQGVPVQHEQVLAFDPSFVPKSGKHTYGIARFWNGTHSRAEKGLEIGVLAWVDVTTNTAYALSVEQTPPAAPAASEHSRIDAYVQHLTRVITAYPLLPLQYLVVDGYFGKKKFVEGICALNFQVIGKLRADANLRYLYTGPRRAGRGRPKLYDGKVDLADLACWERVATPEEHIVLSHAVVHHVQLQRNLHVVVVVDTRTQRSAVLFSTDMALPALTIYRYDKARFQIEFLFRDAKQFTGLTDCQARSQAKLHCHFNASLTAVSLAKLTTQQQPHGDDGPFSMASLKRRAFNQHLLDRIIDHLADGASLEKYRPAYESLCNYGTIIALAA